MPRPDLVIQPQRFNAKQAALYLNISEWTLYRLTSTKMVTARMWRGHRNLTWLREDLDAYLRGLPPREGPVRDDANLRRREPMGAEA